MIIISCPHQNHVKNIKKNNRVLIITLAKQESCFNNIILWIRDSINFIWRIN